MGLEELGERNQPRRRIMKQKSANNGLWVVACEPL